MILLATVVNHDVLRVLWQVCRLVVHGHIWQELWFLFHRDCGIVLVLLFLISSKSIQGWSGFGQVSRPAFSTHSWISSNYFATADIMASPSFGVSLHMMNASAAAQATFAVNAAATAGLEWRHGSR